MDRGTRRAATDADRRDALRAHAGNLPDVDITGEVGEKWRAVLMDVSRRGLCIRSGDSLACGAEVTIEAPEGSCLPPIRARVVRAAEVDLPGEPLFDFGLEFLPASDGRNHLWFLELRQEAT